VKRESFGERLRRLRAEAELTQVQVAERAGVPLTTLRNWETDRREPLASALFKLATALGVSADAFRIDDAPRPGPSPKKGTRSKTY